MGKLEHSKSTKWLESYRDQTDTGRKRKKKKIRKWVPRKDKKEWEFPKRVPVWPELAKFRHFSTMLINLCHFEWAYFVLAKFWAYFGKFSFFKTAKYETNNLAIWSHCSDVTSGRDVFTRLENCSNPPTHTKVCSTRKWNLQLRHRDRFVFGLLRSLWSKGWLSCSSNRWNVYVNKTTTTSCLVFWSDQCDQIVRFIASWATIQILWTQLICPNLLHS